MYTGMAKEPKGRSRDASFFDQIGEQAKTKTVKPVGIVGCPACGETVNIEVRTIPSGVLKICGKCRQRWSGMYVPGDPMPTDHRARAEDVPELDEQDVVPDYRSRAKNYDWDD